MNPDRNFELGLYRRDVEDVELREGLGKKEIIEPQEVIDADEGLLTKVEKDEATISIQSTEVREFQVVEEIDAKKIAELAEKERQNALLTELKELLTALRDSHGVDISGVEKIWETEGDLTEADQILEKMVEKLILEAGRLRPIEEDAEKARIIRRLFELSQEFLEPKLEGKPGEPSFSKGQEISSNI